MLIEGPILVERQGARRMAARPMNKPPLDRPALDTAASDRPASDRLALIGPNAILQALPAMERVLGPNEAQKVLQEARISQLPGGDCMIPEAEALRLHHALSMRDPFEAIEIAVEAGHGTADYIIANRIPGFATALLRLLPAALAAPLLMKAITRHAWTFIGSGAFEPSGGWAFTIDRSDADDLMMPSDSLFEWYAAVFTRLYQRLVHPKAVCHDDGPVAMRRFAHTYRMIIQRRT